MDVIRAPTIRPEIAYHVVPVNSQKHKMSVYQVSIHLIESLRDTLGPDEKGMVFTMSTELTDHLADATQSARHHSRLPGSSTSDDNNLDAWYRGKYKVIVSTPGLVQGIDRWDVRWVIFVEGAFGLLSFAQGAGRPGRDGRSGNVYIVCDDLHCRTLPHPGEFDPADTRMIKSLDVFMSNQSMCRRSLYHQRMDGIKTGASCAEIPSSNPCDICNPSGSFACIGRSVLMDKGAKELTRLQEIQMALAEVHPQLPTNPQQIEPSPPVSADIDRRHDKDFPTQPLSPSAEQRRQ